jgi:hypothetical protein
MDKKSDRFWRQYDRASRVDFGGTLLGFIFDWKAWVSALVGGGGGVLTFLTAAIGDRSPLEVWVFAVVVAAALIVILYLTVSLLEKWKTDGSKRKGGPGPGGAVPGVSNAQVDAASKQLAGVVNALMERSGSYSFKLPVPDDDPFLKQHDELKNSTHPIWTDTAINQLRRDFLQFCYIAGAQAQSLSELQADRAQLRDFGRKLIAKLMGE